MSIRHVFVETNWVVDLTAPTLSRNPGAQELLERGRRGEIVLHLPAISLAEAHKVVRERKAHANLDAIRAFVRDLRSSGVLDESSADNAFEVLSRFQQHVAREKVEAPNRIAALRRERAIDVLPLDDEILIRSTQIAAETGLELQSFDLAILAAVVVRGAAFHAAGHEVSFCTLDADLQPWDRRGDRKSELTSLLDAAGVWVYGDFLLLKPQRPAGWPPPMT